MSHVSLKIKMTLVVSLLVAILLSLMTFFSLAYFKSEYRKMIFSQQFAMVSSTANEVDGKIRILQDELSSVAKALPTTLYADPSRLTAFLNDRITLRSAFENSLYVISPDGTIISATNPKLYTPQNRRLILAALNKTVQSGREQISDPFLSPYDHKAVVLFTAAIRGEDGSVRAVLAGIEDLMKNVFLGELARVTIGKSGYLYLYNSNAICLMHPDPRRVLTALPPGTNPLFDRALAGFEGTAENVNVKGVPVVTSFKRLKTTGWLLSANYPQREAYAPWSKARTYLLCGLVAMLLFSTVVVWLAMRYLAAPLLLLTSRVNALKGSSEAFPPLEVGGRDEISTFAVAFNRLIKDIDRHKKELKDQKSFAESLVMNFSIPAFVIDAKHRLLFWNKACENLTGCTASGILGSRDCWKAFYQHERPTLADLIVDESCDTIASFYEKSSKSELHLGGWHVEGWYKSLESKDCYLCIDAVPIRNEQGEVIAVIQTMHDISDRKQIEEALGQSEERYRFLLANLNLGIGLIDKEFKIQMSNAAYGTMFGKAVSDLVGRDCFFALEGRTGACPDCPGKIALATGKPAFLEKEELHGDGSKVLIRVKAIPVFNAVGEADRFIEIVEDITELKEGEKERELLENQLRHIQKMEALGTLAGGVAHDFNNILTAIMTYCGIIRLKLSPNDAAQDFLEKIVTSALRASALTKSLLTYSRKQPLIFEPVDINETVRNMEDLLLRLLGEGVTASIASSEIPLTVLADSMQIGQVLMNLATNARDAMPEGGLLQIGVAPVTITADFERAHGFGKPGSYALITVSDTGTGMSEETQRRIFEPFYTTKEVGKGTGLGLSIVYGIVKQHHGYICVYSEAGKGTTFTLYLPLTDPKGSPAGESEVLFAPKGKEAILLIEDDQEVREALRRLLEEWGYSTIEAFDGEDGVEKFHQHRDGIRLVILGVVMPKMNGLEVLEVMRRTDSEVRSIFLSAYPGHMLRSKGVLIGDMDFVKKPVSPHNLLLKIREVLKG